MKTKPKYSKYVKFVIYCVVIVLLNIAGLTLFFRIDLTANNIYSISKASQKVVSTLSEPLTLNVFFTKNLPAPYNNIERYLHDLLEEYAIQANKFFNFRFYNVSPEAEGMTPTAGENQKLASDYGIHPVQIRAVEEDAVKFKKAYMGLVLIHGDMVERIPTITTIDGLEYQLTTAIQKLNNKISAFLSLSEKIKVKLILSSSLKEVASLMGLKQLADYPERLKEIVSSLNKKTYDKLEYVHIDPSSGKDSNVKLDDPDLVHLKWPAFPKNNIKAGTGTIGLMMTYGEKTRVIQILDVIRIPIIGTQYNLMELAQLEEVINDNLESLVDINEKIGYLAGHGTLMVTNSPMMMRQGNPDGMTNFSSLVSRGYSIKPIDLKDGTIPDSLGCLIIARPTEKFTDYQLYQIDQALMRGTNLALFLDSFQEVGPQGQMLKPLDTGLQKLLEHYGIRVKKSIVMDQNSHKEVLPRQMGGGEVSIYFVPLIKNRNINKSLNFMKHIKGLVAIRMSPLELNEERISKNNISAFRLFSSSDKSWETKENINLNPMFLRPPDSKEDFESFPLAYLLEGEFSSYFDGKPMPEKTVPKEEKPEDVKKDETGKAEKEADKPKKPDLDLSKIEGKGGFLAKSKRTKIFLMASSEMLKDNVLDREGKTPNALFILNVLDALNQREDIAVLRSKEQRFNPLRDTSTFGKTFIKAFNIAGLPVLVILFGLFIWMRRHSRKKQIQLIFQ